jgi:hypothetical protein
MGNGNTEEGASGTSISDSSPPLCVVMAAMFNDPLLLCEILVSFEEVVTRRMFHGAGIS